MDVSKKTYLVLVFITLFSIKSFAPPEISSRFETSWRPMYNHEEFKKAFSRIQELAQNPEKVVEILGEGWTLKPHPTSPARFKQSFYDTHPPLPPIELQIRKGPTYPRVEYSIDLPDLEIDHLGTKPIEWFKPKFTSDYTEHVFILEHSSGIKYEVVLEEMNMKSEPPKTAHNFEVYGSSFGTEGMAALKKLGDHLPPQQPATPKYLECLQRFGGIGALENLSKHPTAE